MRTTEPTGRPGPAKRYDYRIYRRDATEMLGTITQVTSAAYAVDEYRAQNPGEWGELVAVRFTPAPKAAP